MNLLKLTKVGVAALLLTLAACSGGSDDQAADEDPDTTEVDVDEILEIEPLPEDSALESRNDLENLRPGLITDIEPLDDETIRVQYDLGDTECFGIQLEAFETAEAVELSLRVGNLPGQTDEDCDLSVSERFTDITLENPLGERQPVAAEEREPEEG